ncbi:MAG: 1,6-anhydro-N-acetylmuramyl-L-alanine amidase AmpD [Amphritea sp.]
MSVMQIVDGWLEGIERCPSPNCNERPMYKSKSRQPELLVIHNISLPPKRFGGNYIQQFFQNSLPVDEYPYFSEIAELTVSAHLLIDRKGRLIQFVPFEKRAWHAGISEYRGESNCNDFSIGIELEGADDISYTLKQYEALVNVSAALLSHYPLMTQQDITGHSDIAPQRKTDPGPAFNWDYFQRLLAAKI